MENVEKYKKLYESLKEEVPDSVMEQLAKSRGDVEFCKILADNGIDVEKFEAKIKNSGMKLPPYGSSIEDSQMEQISGGWVPNGFSVNICCPNCGSNRIDDHSDQLWRNLWSGLTGLFDDESGAQYWRCKLCNHYFSVFYGEIKDLGEDI